MPRPAHPQPSGDLPAPSRRRDRAPGPAAGTATSGPATSGTLPEPPATGPRPPAPLDPPMLPFAVGGTAVWVALALAALLFQDELARHGYGSWLWICVAGSLLGVPGMIIMYRHDAPRRRPSAPAGAARGRLSRARTAPRPRRRRPNRRPG